MPFSTDAKNLMLDHLVRGTVAANEITHVSLHNGDPGDTGANEISGGGYARQVITHVTPASAGSISHTSPDPVFSVPAAETILYVGFWSAVTVGTFYGYVPVNGGAVDGVGSGAVDDIITSVGHGLVADDRVFFKKPVGGTLPDLIIEGTLYFVITDGLTVDAFKVAATSEGTPINIGVKGQVYYQKVIPEVFGAAGTLTLNTSTLKLEE
jgi:hypothetical protein